MLGLPDEEQREIDTQAALDDPREGDVFHEMYSFGVQVLDVSPSGVYWRSFNTAEVERGFCSLAEWSQRFRYGGNSSVADKHYMHLSKRGGSDE